jgi:hypothetical protein
MTYVNLLPPVIVYWNDGFRLYCEGACQERIVQGDDYVILPDKRSLCCRCLDDCLGDAESLEGYGLHEKEKENAHHE